MNLAPWCYYAVIALWISGGVGTHAADWPTYQHDNARTATTTEKLALPLVPVWAFRSPHAPIQAWPGPAKWDGYSKTYDLKDRMTFDRVFHVAVVGESLYFGSSVDDQVYCLEAATGQVRWTFYTEGPVRLAPAVDSGKVFVGSDDGHVYCLDAANGTLVWKYRLGPRDQRTPGNGRIVSLWPVRSGVTVIDGKAYACAGVFPSEKVYVAAMDAATGKELWKTAITDVTAQGYLLASDARLYITTGRERPVVLDRKTGRRLHQVKGGGGGTYALLTGDTLLYGPGKTGEMSVFGPGQKEQLATFPGNHMIVTSGLSYLHTDERLSALDRPAYLKLYVERTKCNRRREQIKEQLKKLRGPEHKEKVEALKKESAALHLKAAKLTAAMPGCYQWHQDCGYPLSLVLAGDVLLAGGFNKIGALRATTGEEIWNARVDGDAHGLAVSGGRLFVSTDRGVIHCFQPARGESIRVVRNTVAPKPFRLRQQPPPGGLHDEFHGPFLEFQGPGRVRITWSTETPLSSVVEFKRAQTPNAPVQRVAVDGVRLHHSVEVGELSAETVYSVVLKGVGVDGRERTTATYEFDSSFDYRPVIVRPGKARRGDRWDALYEGHARRLVEMLASRRGYCIVLGAGDGRLAHEIALKSDLKIIAVARDEASARRARAALIKTDLYGVRIAVHTAEDLKRLPYGPYFANLIVADTTLTDAGLPWDFQDVYRSLRPSGGVLVVGTWKAAPVADAKPEKLRKRLGAWSTSVVHRGDTREVKDFADGTFLVYRRGTLPGAGEWTHQYGAADNASCSYDQWVKGRLGVLWWGRPGPRPMPDRGPRNPAPLYSDGRLYVQGNRTLFGMDAYNGTILWAKQMPTMRRANVPRSSSNMAAAPETLYVAVGAYCVGFNGVTGEREVNFRVSDSPSETGYEWGYAAVVGDTLVGSATKKGATYLGDQGEWFEKFKKESISRVTSDRLFVVARQSGAQRWEYRGGIILNATITIADGVIYFIESRSETAKKASSGRLFDSVLKDQWLVALDHKSGQLLWEKPFDFSKCQFMTYLSYGRDPAPSPNSARPRGDSARPRRRGVVDVGTLLVTGTDEKKNYHTYGFNAGDGKLLWEHHVDAKKTHHSGHLNHPVIIGSEVHLNKHRYDLRTGKILKTETFDYHGCGTMSASAKAIFHRFEFHGMWDLESDTRTEFLGIRGGCWLGQIPAGGLLLAPESGAGCSCTHAIQTSIAYYPLAAVKASGGKD